MKENTFSKPSTWLVLVLPSSVRSARRPRNSFVLAKPPLIRERSNTLELFGLRQRKGQISFLLSYIRGRVKITPEIIHFSSKDDKFAVKPKTAIVQTSRNTLFNTRNSLISNQSFSSLADSDLFVFFPVYWMITWDTRHG